MFLPTKKEQNRAKLFTFNIQRDRFSAKYLRQRTSTVVMQFTTNFKAEPVDHVIK